MITYWLLFIVLFGVVVFIHELGHFTVAKLCGVYVERFALGFGPAILRKKWGETEYAICALPLGGYVKMRGEDIEEAKNAPPDPRSFAQIAPWKRIAIVAMGPTSNLILPIILFSALFMAGMPTLVSQIGWVMPGSPADQAGLKPGDRILAVNHQNIWKWSDMEETLRKFPGKEVALSVERAGSTLEVPVVPKTESDVNHFGDEISVGKIGVGPNSYRPVIGVRSPTSVAARLGLKNGDIVTALNGQPISYWWQFVERFPQSPTPKKLTLERPNAAGSESTKKEITLPATVKTLEDAGIEDGELYIREVLPDSVAALKGLKPGDRLAKVNGETLNNWAGFQQKIRQNAGENIVLTILRDGKPMDVHFIPKEVTDKNSITQEKEKRRQLGVVSVSVPGELTQKAERYLNPFTALYHGTVMTYEMVSLTVQGLWKLVTGKLALKKSLGGPISIFYLAGGSYESGGWSAFVRMMALLSITLGVVNFLPIPILDGGHLLFFIIEAIRGNPVNVRVRELAQQVGLILIIGLMLLTFYVDIERYFLDRIKSLF